MITSQDSQATPTRPRNPYRGPREFRREDQLPNRGREARELTDCVIAERIVLLHSPSGAGKTSLVEAAVVGHLKEEGFWPTPRLRVNRPPSSESSRNQYTQSLVNYLLADSEEACNLTLAQAIKRWQSLEQPEDKTTVLVIDQLEEILTIDPTDWAKQEDFFRELGALLKREPIWALLSMREDYMGGLDRYLRFLPGLLRARYRLDYLTRHDAKLAMQVPAKEQGVDFTDAAAEALADRLAVVKVQLPGEEQETVKTPYVEPFQLQVICRLLWKRARKARGDNFPLIEVADVNDYADIEEALTDYFSKTVETVVEKICTPEPSAEKPGTAEKPSTVERKIRDWFESELITERHIRTQTLKPPQIMKAQEVLGQLEDGYLVRGDVRGNTTWYELAHDRLIGAVLASNEAWRWKNLDPWQIAAYEWNAGGRNQAFLLPAKDIPIVRRDTTRLENDFLQASSNQAKQNGALALTRGFMGLFGFAALIEAVAIIVLLILLFTR
jgi:Novel STAND NTPase 1